MRQRSVAATAPPNVAFVRLRLVHRGARDRLHQLISRFPSQRRCTGRRLLRGDLIFKTIGPWKIGNQTCAKMLTVATRIKEIASMNLLQPTDELSLLVAAEIREATHGGQARLLYHI
ncbi:MAG: hypothetical protein R3C05_05675 [Pirellulaceae bacterium]